MSLAERLPALALTGRIDKTVIDGIMRDLPRIIESIPVQFTPEFIDEYIEKINQMGKNVRPIIVSSHTSHMDGPPLASVSKKIIDFNNSVFPENQLQGFVIPVASSMLTGHQGSIVK